MTPLFPFLGHGVHSSKSAKLWLAGEPELAARFPGARQAGPAFAIELAQPPLAEEFAKLPVWLAAWPGRVKTSPWHRESLRDERIFPVLLKVVRSAPEYFTPRAASGAGRLHRADEGPALSRLKLSEE